MIWQKRGVDSTQDNFRHRVSFPVEPNRIMNCLPRVGKQRSNIHDIRLESYVLFASYESDVISLALVQGRNLQQSKGRVASVIVRLYKQYTISKGSGPPHGW